MTYLHYIAYCEANHTNPLHYPQWLRITASMGL